jgi:hypothetical protein
MSDTSKADILLKVEFDSKIDYTPKGEEALFNEELEASWTNAKAQYDRRYNFLQRRTLAEFLTFCESDSYALGYPSRKDRWRNNHRSLIQREKAEAIEAAVADANLQPENRSYSIYGESLREMTEAMDVLGEHADGLNDSEEKDRHAVRQLLRDGTRCEDIVWRVQHRPSRAVTKFDWKSGEIEFADTGKTSIDERIWTQGRPLNRVLLTDLRNPYVEDQAAWKVTPMRYDLWKSMFGGWECAKYVRPINSDQYLRNETPSQIESNWQEGMTDVVIRVYEDPLRDIYAMFFNQVRATPLNCPMPSRFTEKRHSFIWSIGPFPFDEHFALGDSLYRRTHNDAAIWDFIYNALTDRGRQELEPPTITSFRTILNRHMYAPGKSTPVGPDFKVERLIPDGANVINQSLAMAEFVKENINRATIADIMQGQRKGGGSQTLGEIQEELRAAWRTIWHILFSVAMLKKRRREAMNALILEHYPTLNAGIAMKGNISTAAGGISKVFSSTRSLDSGESEMRVAFADMSKMSPQVGRDLSDEFFKDKLQNGGKREWLLVDPDALRKQRHMVFISVNPADRKSKKTDRIKDIEDYNMRLANPYINPEKNAESLVIAQGKDPKDWVKAPAQPVPMGTSAPAAPQPNPSQMPV